MARTLYFCTYFDSNYLSVGLALYRSLVRYASPFRLWVLCLDEEVYRILQSLALPENAVQSLDEMVAWADLAIKKYSEFIVEWEEYFQNPERR